LPVWGFGGMKGTASQWVSPAHADMQQQAGSGGFCGLQSAAFHRGPPTLHVDGGDDEQST
jgi:hypothetical protein